MSDPKDREAVAAVPTLPEVTDSPSLVPFHWANQLPDIPINWLVKDVFLATSVNLIVGESTAGKSYIALDLAAALATGRAFLGKVVTTGGVLYIAAEGQPTIRRRIMAALRGLAIDEELIAVIQEPPSDLMNSTEIDRIIATANHISDEMLKATGLPLVMIIIDTMIAAFDISDWNSVAETSRVFKILRRFKDEVGSAVIGVHHQGKEKSRGAAGSYALTAHPDAILSVYKKEKDDAVTGRFVTLSKSRFGETGRKIAFDLAAKPPDHRIADSDNEVFVVPLLKKSGEAESKTSKSVTSKGDECFIAAFEAALDDQGEDGEVDDVAVRGVSLPLVKDRFSKLYRPKNSEKPQEAINRAWKRALEKNRNGPIEYGEDGDQEWLYIKKVNDEPEADRD